MKVNRSIVIAAALVVGLAAAGWAQQLQYAKIPVRGIVENTENIAFDGFINVTWRDGEQGSTAVLVADAVCPECGSHMTLYSISTGPLPRAFASGGAFTLSQPFWTISPSSHSDFSGSLSADVHVAVGRDAHEVQEIELVSR